MAINYRKMALTMLLFVFLAGFFLLILSPPVLYAAPVINETTPLRGGIGGGYLVEITGTGFTADSIVRIDGRNARVMQFLPEVGQTPGRLTVEVPPGTSVGRKDVLVLNPDMTWDLWVGGFEYLPGPVINFITPNSGQTGTGIEVRGSSFQLGDTVAVRVGGILAPLLPGKPFTDTSLWVAAPPGLTGTVSLELSIIRGGVETDERTRIPAAFTYTAEVSNPEITGLLPVNTGLTAGGQAITISGRDFRVAVGVPDPVFPRVYFGLQQAVVTSVSTDSITVLTPPNTAGAKNVLVVNPDGRRSNTLAFHYIDAALRVDSVTPNFGPVSGGTEIVIRGASFSADLATLVVQVGYTGADGVERFEAARFKFPADKVQIDGQGERMTVFTPPHTQGWKSVRVRNIYGEYIMPNAFLYLPPVFSSPLITGLAPEQGPVTGGITAFIYGENFATGAEVRFGPVAAPPAAVTVESLQRIRVVTPPSVPGWQEVTVVNPDGQKFTWWTPPRDINDPADPAARGFFYYSTPVITSLNPSRGAVAGGGVIEIHGSQFFPGIRVVFGQAGQTVHQEVYEAHLVNSGKLRVRLPKVANPASNIAVTVINKDGGSFTLPGAFSYVTAVALPQVERVVPDFGPVGGRIEALITGQNFPPNPVVYFGWERVLQVVSASTNQLRVLIPANPPGIYPVTVINPNNMGAGVLADAFQYLSAITSPAITAVSPPRGSKAGGTRVTIWGENFWEGARVFFGPREVPREQVEFRGADLLKVLTPSGDLGPADVRVVNPDGGSALRRDAFTYLSPAPEHLPIITSITPNRGKTAGRTFVTISGNNFWQGIEVFFSGLPALSITRIDRDTLTMETPPHPPGRVEVTVANQDGGVATVVYGFEYLLPGSRPVITAIAPALGMAGTETPVTITGGDFRPGLQVLFGGVPGRIESIDYERIVVFTPRLPEGRVNVTVINLDLGSVTQPNGFEFRSSVPRIISVQPGAGSREGGDIVYLTGENLIRDPGFKLYFGNTRVPDTAMEWLDDQTLKIVTPSGPFGFVDLKVINPDGEEHLLRRGFLYRSPASGPKITGVTPAAGPTAGGIWVTLRGADFRHEAMVYFQGQPATRVRLVNSGELMALLPPFRPGEVDVTLVNYDGGSYTLAGAFTYRVPESNPRIDRVEPNQGPHLGGTAFTLIGLDFRPGIKVFFDGVEALQVQFQDYRTLTGVTPPGAAGPLDVTVLNSDQGVFTLIRGFSYFQVSEPVITAVSPSQGPAAGGTAITITGRRFAREVKVTLGGQPTRDLRWISEETLQMLTPPGFAGWREIRVINPDGGFTARGEGFYYQRPRTAPGRPGWLSVATHDQTTLRLNWPATEFAEYYEVFTSESSTGTFRFLTQAREPDYFVTGLDPDRRYYFRLRAVNELGPSAFTETVHGRTSPGAWDQESQPQIRTVAGGTEVQVIIPAENLFLRHHRINLNQPEYRRATRFSVSLLAEVARAAPRSLIVDTGILQLNMVPRALWIPLLPNQGPTADTWARVTIAYLGQAAGEQALAALPRGSRLLSPVIQVLWETQVGHRAFPHERFHGPVGLSFNPDALNHRPRIAIYYFNNASQAWQIAPRPADPRSPVLTVELWEPGRFVLVELP